MYAPRIKGKEMTADSLSYCNFQIRKFGIWKKALLIENTFALRDDEDLFARTISEMKRDVVELKHEVKEFRNEMSATIKESMR